MTTKLMPAAALLAALCAGCVSAEPVPGPDNRAARALTCHVWRMNDCLRAAAQGCAGGYEILSQTAHENYVRLLTRCKV